MTCPVSPGQGGGTLPRRDRAVRALAGRVARATSMSAASSPMRSGNGDSAGSWRHERSRSGRAALPPRVRAETGAGARSRVELSIVSEELVRLAQLTNTLASHLEAAVEARRPRRFAATWRHLHDPGGAADDPGERHELAIPLGEYGTWLMAEQPPGRGGGPPPGDRPRSRATPSSLNNLAWAPGQRARRPSLRPGPGPRGGPQGREPEARELDASGTPWAWPPTAPATGKTAAEALEKSMSLNKGGEAADWFFLAMTRWRQGQPAEARKWFDRAVAWTRKNQPEDPELRASRPRPRGSWDRRSPRPRSPPPRVDGDQTTGPLSADGGGRRWLRVCCRRAAAPSMPPRPIDSTAVLGISISAPFSLRPS